MNKVHHFIDKLLSLIDNIVRYIYRSSSHCSPYFGYLALCCGELRYREKRIAMKEGQLLGKYQLRQLLGQGGMAEVWRALDTQLQREVAIKIMRPNLQSDPDFLSHFRQEAQIVASLNHPNIVKIYDFATAHSDETEGPIAYMVMQYVDGPTLATSIAMTSHKRNFPFPKDIVRLFTAISQAIDYAHQRGMLHRDLKPSNILLDSHNVTHCSMGEPMITDFGIAKLVGSSTGVLTRSSIGTPYYMSPEQAQGHTGDQRSDLYSLGVILYEICTGEVPFKGGSELAILVKHLHEQPANPISINPQLPPAVAQVILRCLEKDPSRRFPTASSLTIALAEAFGLPAPLELQPLALATELRNETVLMSQASLSGLSPTVQAPNPVTSGPDAPTYLIQQSRVPAPSTPAPPVPATMPTVKAAEQQAAPPRPPRRRVSPIVWGGLVLLVVAIIAGSIATISLQRGRATTSLPSGKTGGAGATFSGQASLMSSFQTDLTQVNSPGLDDELVLNAQNIPAPPSGKVYCIWLLSNTDGPPTLVGTFTPANGQVHQSYQSRQHQDLLLLSSNLLITAENANAIPSSPTFSNAVYYATISTTKTQGFSLYDHLQHLTAYDPVEHIKGGLAVWLNDNTARVWGWSIIAQGYWNGGQTGTSGADFIRGQAIHILDVIDGMNNLPAGIAFDQRDTPIAEHGLLAPNQNSFGYIDHTTFHLVSVAASPGVTPDMQKQASSINQQLVNVRGWLEQVRKDAQQLVMLSDQQYQQASTLALLNDMELNADYAYNGQINPTTGQVQHAGIRQIVNEIQQLVVFNLQPCPQGKACV
jgi:serine/threonine protein kinase